MTAVTDVPVGQKFSFQVYPSALLGNNFSGVIMDGILTPALAIALGTDIAALHANVYPSLPAGTPNDPMQYNYVRIRFPNSSGSTSGMVLGIPWIRADTITLSTGRTLTLRFTDVTDVDKDAIIMALSANGYKPTNTIYE